MINRPLVSVIMSTYNETIQELERSVGSILNQTYENIEFIIVCDNPQNVGVIEFLKGLEDNRIKLIINDQNLGLVESLNKALKESAGDYIARMDADDESLSNRIEIQINYIEKFKYDLIGGSIHLINEAEEKIGDICFLTNENYIKYFIKFVPCFAHPTWMVKREVYERLKGYRKIEYCEDYDFLLRAIYLGFHLGNVPKFCLNYQIRKNGISQSNIEEQKIRTIYLAGMNSKILTIQERDFSNYIDSEDYKIQIEQYKKYEKLKLEISCYSIRACCLILFNRYFYKAVYNKMLLIIVKIILRFNNREG